MNKVITTGSHFSGYGSYLFALDLLGIPYRSLFACEIDKYARKTYEANHSTGIFYKDVTEPEILEAPPVDLFVSSPPCQSFSNAGRREGVNDTRGTLFHYSKEYIKLRRPRFFIIENVKGLLTIDGGAVFNTWISSLGNFFNGGGAQRSLFGEPEDKSAGYFLRYFVLNSKEVGYPEPVPHSRGRIFIIGFRDREDYEEYQTPERSVLNKKLIDLLDNDFDNKYIISDKLYNTFVRRSGDTSTGFRISVSPEVCTCIRAGYYKLYGDQTYIGIGEGKIRRLNPVECSRLMGLPESFIQPNSDTQAYKQYGNSIVINTLAAIIKNLPL